MKKIIAISVMFALVAGAVFADTAIGGNVETRFTLVAGGGDDDPVMYGSVADAQIQLSGSNTDGTLGGLFRLRNEDIVRGTPWFHRAFVWWKPVEQVKIFLGIDNDGLFDTADFLGWSFHAGDNDYLFNHHWDFWRQLFPGNWDGFGLAFSFYPMPGFDLNLVLPTGGVNWPQATQSQIETKREISGDAGMLPGRLRFTGNYSLDFGKISFAYLGGVGVKEKGGLGNIDGDNNGMFGLSFLVTAIEGIQIKVGGSVVLNTDSDMLISAGLGVAWAGEGFGVKFRAGLVTQGDADMFITGNIMPYFAVGDNGQVLVDIGVTSCGDDMGWYVTPAYRLGLDGGAFKIGIQLYNNIKMGGNIGVVGTVMSGTAVQYEGDFVKWNIPMLLAFNF